MFTTSYITKLALALVLSFVWLVILSVELKYLLLIVCFDSFLQPLLHLSSALHTELVHKETSEVLGLELAALTASPLEALLLLDCMRTKAFSLNRLVDIKQRSSLLVVEFID